MSLDALRERLPAYAKDISLNLSSLAAETVPVSYTHLTLPTIYSV